jgi:hypothetical protein
MHSDLSLRQLFKESSRERWNVFLLIQLIDDGSGGIESRCPDKVDAASLH